MEKQIPFCKKCSWTKELFDKELKKLEEYIARIPEEDKVSREEYEKRLALCDVCKEQRGGLCGECGCYVAVRGVRKTGYCPHIQRKW